MTTATAPRPALTNSPARPAYRLSFLRLLRSEWIKLMSLRSTWWSLVVVIVMSIGLSMLVAGSVSSQLLASGIPADQAAGAGLVAVTGPMQFSMLLAGSLGAIAVTGEYSTGMIRSSLTAEPRRGGVLAAKAIVVAALLFAVSLAIFIIAAVVTAPILGEAAVDWSDSSMSLVPIFYGALSMACFALLGLSCGFILRNGPGAISLVIGILFILPILPNLFAFGGGWDWVRDIAQYLPMSAAQSLTSPGEGGLADPIALLTLLAWVGVGLAGSWAVLRTRDA